MTAHAGEAKPTGWPAGVHLLVFAVLVAVPLILVTGALMLRAIQLERQQVDGRVVQVLRGIVDELDRDIDRQLAVLTTLATSPALAAADWSAFYNQARASLGGRAYVVLLDVEGRQLVNTFVPYGQAPAMTGNPETVARMRAASGPVVSDLFVSLVTQQPVYTISIPVLHDGALRYILSIGLTPRDLNELLQNVEPGWTAMIWDSKGRILARSRDHSRFVGTMVPQQLREALQSKVLRATDIDDVDVLAAAETSGLSRWRIAVGFPAAVIDRQVNESLLFWGGTIVLAAAIMLGLAFVFGREITRPLAGAAAAARALGRRQPFDVPASRLREANAVIAALRKAASDLDESSAALRDSEARLRTAAEAAQFGAHEHDVATDVTIRSPQLRRLLGAGEAAQKGSFESEIAFVHPDDQAAVRQRKQQILAGTQADYELEYRIQRPDGTVRWVMDRGQVSRGSDLKARRVLGVLIDISQMKAAEQRQRLLFDELNHRVKNTLAIVQSLAQQTLRVNPDPRAFAGTFGDRLAALARAHDLLMQEAWQGTPLREIIATALAPFISQGRSIDISGAAVTVPAGVTITLCLMLHELASNAAKFGALSVADGRLLISWTVASAAAGEAVELAWIERNGPVVVPPTRKGFGARLFAAGSLQIDGRHELDYAPEGLRYRLSFAVPRPEEVRA